MSDFFNRKSFFIVLAFGLLFLPAFWFSTKVDFAEFSHTQIDQTEDGLEMLKLPAGYSINFFAPPSLGLKSPRQLAEGEDGWVFAGSSAGKVYALRDSDRDGRADEARVIADGMSWPHGVAFQGGNLYVGAIDGVYKVVDIMGKLSGSGEITLRRIVSELYESAHHGARHLKISPDGMLYVSLGAPCNVCEPPMPDLTGVISRYDLNGGKGEVYSRGVRNSVGFDFHPKTGELWFTDNGRDWLGDDLPHDELNYAPRAGMHFGYPYCHQGNYPDPEYGEGKLCSDYEPPALLTGAHVANLGMSFDPAGEYVYIALHGSWNRSEKSGYAVYRAKVDGGEVSGYEPFVEGWLSKDGSVSGRPVDVIFLTDGGMLISDDFAGVVYRVVKRR